MTGSLVNRLLIRKVTSDAWHVTRKYSIRGSFGFNRVYGVRKTTDYVIKNSDALCNQFCRKQMTATAIAPLTLACFPRAIFKC